MKQRCYNKNNIKYKDYGARGIKVCEEWLNNPKSFYEWSINNGYQDNLTIDRINNDKGYFPENCRWTTAQTQACNRRKRIDNSSGVTGVYFEKSCNKWRCNFKRNGEYISRKIFNTKEEAIKERLKLEQEYKGGI